MAQDKTKALNIGQEMVTAFSKDDLEALKQNLLQTKTPLLY